MEKDLIGKATFSEVYRFLKNKPDSDIFQCFKSLFGVALLFFPALICREFAGTVVNIGIINDLATGATLAGAGVGAIVSKAAGNAFALFTNKDHGDYTTRYDQMQIAQVLLVYAAYFDTISQFLPNENGEIVLSPNVKQKISQDGFHKYLKELEESAQQQKSMHKLLDSEFVLPTPTQKFSSYLEGLKNFYMALNTEFIKFFESLCFWKEIDREQDESDREQKRYFSDILHKLPETALCIYEKQYFELSKEFPEFAMWANHTEHVRLEGQIDIGFKQIAGQMRELYAKVSHIENHAFDTLTHYYNRYSDYINNSIITDKKDDFNEGIVFPCQKDIFIPQAFQTLTYQKSMQLEQNDTWKDAFSGDEIGQYIRNILCHPKYGDLPMLILGFPGAGKTLLCHMLAAQILSAEYYVIIIRLRDAIAEDTIMKQIDAQIEKDLGDNCTWNDLRSASLDKPLVLIFDGYDELLQASGKTYSNYINKIAEFQEQQKSIYHVVVRCIITSRVTLIDKASIPYSCHILRLCDFDNTRISTWCQVWNDANAQYFSAHKLKNLEIAETGRINELAGQPLLLMMLALYDINGNRLQEQGDMSRAELYYRLIRDFVKREREKNSVFNQLVQEKKEKEIRDGFRHLGIVALGMYNRKKLYIRTTELNRDLAFLTPGGIRTDDTDENALEEADKHVAGFFFVYSSHSTIQNNGIHTKIAAYEFLHNTFGEFLTAHFILDMSFRLIKRQMMDAEQGEAFSWPRELKKEWYTGLAYAPLFTRPVVMNMIHELSIIMADENKIVTASVAKALDSLFGEEIRHIIVGDIFSELNDTLNMQGNPFKHPELMAHVAIYSINLILLRLIVCSDSFVFTDALGTEADWQKLTHIWRYAFSEEELVNLSCLIKLNNSGKGVKLTYSFDEEATNRVAYLSKLDRMRQISNVLGDDAAYAVFSVFDAPIDSKIRSILKKEGLGLETRYALNAIMRCLTLSTVIRKEDIDSLYELFQYCNKENDALGLYVYCVTVRSLIDLRLVDTEDATQLLTPRIFRVLNKFVQNLIGEQGWIFVDIISKEILKNIYVLPNQQKIIFIQEFIRFYSYKIRHISGELHRFDIVGRCIIDIFVSFSREVQNAIEKQKNSADDLGQLYFSFLRESEDIYYSFSWKEMTAVMWVCRVLRKNGYGRVSSDIFEYSMHYFYRRNPDMFLESCRPSCLSLVLECCFYLRYYDKGRDSFLYTFFIEQYTGVEDIAKRLLPYYETAFGDLICLICDDTVSLQTEWNDIPEEMCRVVKQYSDRLSIRTLNKIKEYGELIHNKGICFQVEKAISQNRNKKFEQQ